MGLLATLTQSTILLVRRCWAGLTTWLLLGIVGSWAMRRIAYGVAVAGGGDDWWQPVGATALFALAIMIKLVAVVGMFLVVAQTLSETHTTTLLEPDDDFIPHLLGGERLLDAIAAALLPLVVFYGAWGLFQQDWGEFVGTLILELGARPPVGGNAALASAGVAFILRLATEVGWERTGRPVLGILAAVFEGLWMVLALIGLQPLIERAVNWIRERVIIDWFGDAYDAMLSPLSGVLPDLSDGLLLPMLWLVIGAVVIFNLAEHSASETNPQRGRAMRLVLLATGEIREKYEPMLHGVRLVLRAGALLFLAYAAAYATVLALGDWLMIGVFHTIGPRPFAFWAAFDDTLYSFESLLVEPLRITLIVACALLVTRRARARAHEQPQPDSAEG